MISKRYKALPQETKQLKHDSIENLLRTVIKNCTTKFNESIDVSLLLNIKQKKEEFNLRTVVNLPNGNGKKIRVAVLCEENKIAEAKNSGADLFGSDTLFNESSIFRSISSKVLLIFCAYAEKAPVSKRAISVSSANPFFIFFILN